MNLAKGGLVEKTMEWKHTDSGKEKFLGSGISKEGHTDILLRHKRTHCYWFPWKGCNCIQYQLL